MNSPLERQADRVAERVMRMPEGGRATLAVSRSSAPANVLQRACSECSQEEQASRAITPAFGDRLAQLRGAGAKLEAPTQRFMSTRFGTTFEGVRVHTGTASTALAKSIGARAFTVGSDVFFQTSEYRPETRAGKQLIAHELAHVVQQRGASPQSGAVVQRQPENGAAQESSTSGEDPNFLMCLALCELGIPPNLWRRITSFLFQAVNAEFRQQMGELHGSAEFERWRAGVTVLGTFNKVKLVVTFLAGEGLSAKILLRSGAARALQQRALAYLAAAGVREASVLVASQIVRKVALFIEGAVLAGCATFCGAEAGGRALVDFSSAFAESLSSFVGTTAQLAGQLGSSVRNAISKALLIGVATADPANWHLSSWIPARGRAHLNVIGLAFRLAATPDAFLASMSRPLGSYPIRGILAELATDLNTALTRRGGFSVFGATFSADFLGRLTPLGLIDLLRNFGLLSFVEAPGAIAERQLQQAGAAR